MGSVTKIIDGQEDAGTELARLQKVVAQQAIVLGEMERELALAYGGTTGAGSFTKDGRCQVLKPEVKQCDVDEHGHVTVS